MILGYYIGEIDRKQNKILVNITTIHKNFIHFKFFIRPFSVFGLSYRISKEYVVILDLKNLENILEII